MLTIKTLWDTDTDSYPEDLLGPEDAQAELLAFYVGWDPYGISWAPDVVDAAGHSRKCRCDPEKHRFRAPGPAVVDEPLAETSPDALTEQDVADALDEA
eukprot:7032561-Pyramimonas_sp.AAC.1